MGNKIWPVLSFTGSYTIDIFTRQTAKPHVRKCRPGLDDQPDEEYVRLERLTSVSLSSRCSFNSVHDNGAVTIRSDSEAASRTLQDVKFDSEVISYTQS